MTDAGAEQAQEGTGNFCDVVGVQVMDESLLLGFRVVRRPASGSAAASVVAIADGARAVETHVEADGGIEDWECAVAGPLQLTIEEPLERWTVSLEMPDAEMSLELRALTPPLDLDEPATASIRHQTAIQRYSQLCEAQGTVRIGGRSRTVAGLAIRTHHFGSVGGAGRVRFLTAAAQTGTLLGIAAVRPAEVATHGDELIGGHTLRADGESAGGPQPYETVRVSTVFDDHGAPLKAGAELFRPGDELPSRLAGVAVAEAVRDGTQSSATLFRFSLDGVPAVGSYEIETGA